MWSDKSRTLLFSIALAFCTLPGVLARSSSGGWKRIPFNLQNPPPEFRAYANNPDFSDPSAAVQRLRQAWLDMWHMAAVACVTLNEEEDVYRRYFEADADQSGASEGSTSEMVRWIFCNVAGIDDPTTCDITRMGPISNVHMQDLSIIAGRALPNEVPPDEQPDLDNPDLEISATTFQDLGPEGQKAYTQMYKRAFDFPSLNDIFNKRTCSGLGQYDSGFMTSLGAHLVHEMIHWRLLVRDLNNKQKYDEIIPHTIYLPDPEDEEEDEEVVQDFIDDYNKNEYKDPDIDPSTGYGPANTHLLVINGGMASFRNADNYRWYAVSKYWSWRCTLAARGQKVVFGQQDNNQIGDDIIPLGCDGQIPCPDSNE